MTNAKREVAQARAGAAANAWRPSPAPERNLAHARTTAGAGFRKECAVSHGNGRGPMHGLQCNSPSSEKLPSAGEAALESSEAGAGYVHP